MAARYFNDIDIAKSQRDFELKKAAYDQEVRTKTAQSDLAYALQVCLALQSPFTGHVMKLQNIS